MMLCIIHQAQNSFALPGYYVLPGNINAISMMLYNDVNSLEILHKTNTTCKWIVEMCEFDNFEFKKFEYKLHILTSDFIKLDLM